MQPNHHLATSPRRKSRSDSLLVRSDHGAANTPLHIVILNAGDPQLLQAILLEKNQVNEKNANQETPLHLAAKLGNLAAVKLLITHNADHRIKNDEGLTPFLLACQKNHLPIVTYLWAQQSLDDHKKGLKIAKENKAAQVGAFIIKKLAPEFIQSRPRLKPNQKTGLASWTHHQVKVSDAIQTSTYQYLSLSRCFFSAIAPSLSWFQQGTLTGLGALIGHTAFNAALYQGPHLLQSTSKQYCSPRVNKYVQFAINATFCGAYLNYLYQSPWEAMTNLIFSHLSLEATSWLTTYAPLNGTAYFLGQLTGTYASHRLRHHFSPCLHTGDTLYQCAFPRQTQATLAKATLFAHYPLNATKTLLEESIPTVLFEDSHLTLSCNKTLQPSELLTQNQISWYLPFHMTPLQNCSNATLKATLNLKTHHQKAQTHIAVEQIDWQKSCGLNKSALTQKIKEKLNPAFKKTATHLTKTLNTALEDFLLGLKSAPTNLGFHPTQTQFTITPQIKDDKIKLTLNGASQLQFHFSNTHLQHLIDRYALKEKYPLYNGITLNQITQLTFAKKQLSFNAILQYDSKKYPFHIKAIPAYTPNEGFSLKTLDYQQLTKQYTLDNHLLDLAHEPITAGLKNYLYLCLNKIFNQLFSQEIIYDALTKYQGDLNIEHIDATLNNLQADDGLSITLGAKPSSSWLGKHFLPYWNKQSANNAPGCNLCETTPNPSVLSSLFNYVEGFFKKEDKTPKDRKYTLC